MNKKTLVLGASEKEWRYSYQAVKLLTAYGHDVEAVGAKEGRIGTVAIQTGQPAVSDVHTVTMYLSPERQAAVMPYIMSLQPRRIIFNPGSENPELEQYATSKGIEVLEACTLVMLRTNQY